MFIGVTNGMKQETISNTNKH